jgi:phosphoglycerate dehydrogenase-like enzyme
LKIAVPDDHPPLLTDSGALARLKSQSDAEVTIWNSRPADETDLLERIDGAHTVISIRATTPFTRHVLESSPHMRHLAIWGTGVDNVDQAAAKRMNITVSHTPDTATDAVAEHCLALLLSIARKVPELDSRVRNGDWPRGLLIQLSGKTLGIVGTGVIGRRLAKLASGIGMQVVAWTLRPDDGWAASSGVEYVEFGTLLRDSDAISMHLRLSADTRHIISSDALAQMKPEALLVNVARGELIDEAALAGALQNGVIAGAALDVLENEPLAADNPLRNLSNVILSPHTAGTTSEALTAGLEMVVDNAFGFISGAKLNSVV